MQTHVQHERSRADALDDALDRLSTYRFVDGPGMATHGPMGAEAVSTLGHDDLVVAWVEGYKARHAVLDAPPRRIRLDPDDRASWSPALGDPARLSDWDDLFQRQLQEHPWPDVVRRWVPGLLAGYAGAFTHGLIRTAHAVRAAQTQDPPSPLVRRELARALAYWAGTYKVLPGQPRLRGRLTLDEAIARLPRPGQPWTPMEAGMFTHLGELPDFPEAVEALGPPDHVEEALSDLTASWAGLLLAHPEAHPFGLVHAVTPVAGARTLAPYLPQVTTAELYAQLWQVDAAITVGFVPTPGPHESDQARLTAGPSDEVDPPEELTARAVEHRDPHVVKFTEACLREHAIRPDPAYLRAARQVLDRTSPW